MIEVTEPVSQFFDLDGTPLDEGRIYVGASGQNPETTPQALFWDYDGLIPAAQPIETRNGYPYRDGAASKFYTSLANFSITVRNKRGELVLSVLDTDSGIFDELMLPTGSASIGYDNASSGLAATNVQDAIDEIVSDFSALQTEVDESLIERNIVDNVNGNRVRRREEEVGFLDDGPFAAGVFIVDRWKAGASGCTLVATSPNVAQLPLFNIASGTVVQQLARNFQTGDQVVLAWDGGAEARINGSSWNTSPFVYSFAAPANLPEIEFRVGTNGIARNIRMRKGSVDYGILAKDAYGPGEEYDYLGKYYQTIQFGRQFFAAAAGENDLTTVGFPAMISVPTPSVISTTTSTNVTTFTPFVTTRNSLRCLVVATAAAATTRISLLALDTGL